MGNAKLVVNLKSIENNINTIKTYIGKDVTIMLVIKANGYGTYFNTQKEILNKFDYVSVAFLKEALELRKNGYQNNILILFPLNKNDLIIAINNHFIVNGSNIFEIGIDDIKETIIIHIELETGMGRTGLQKKDFNNYLYELKNHQNIVVDGLFTHLSSSNSNIEFSKMQIQKFINYKKYFNKNGINPRWYHILCSGGLKNYKNNMFNMIRVGLAIYGYYPNNNLKTDISLIPAIILKSKPSFIKTISKGDTVGYNKYFTAKKKSKIATIPIGFADGLSNLDIDVAYVIVNNCKARVIGICMDNIMVDITGINNVTYDTDFYIWDNKKLSVETVASWCNATCNYVLLSSISNRVTREFINENEEGL